MNESVFYVTIGQIQDLLDDHFRKFGKSLSLPDAISQLYAAGHYTTNLENYKVLPKLDHLDFHDFTDSIRDIQFEVDLEEIDFIRKDISEFHSNSIDVFLQNSFHHVECKEHSHMNFEIIYVYRGRYDFSFMDEKRILTEGDVVIISPNAVHRLEEAENDSFMVSMYLNLQTMNTTFLSILQGQNFMSAFFKEVLTNQSAPNYLLLSTGVKKNLKYRIQDMLIEQHKYDEYSPECSLSLLKVFLSNVMRCYSGFHQYSCCGVHMDFGPVLEYINHNYKTSSLGEIAEHFNYSESYLSTTIRKVTGKTYSQIVKQARLQEALGYLQHTDKTVAAIAVLCGYNDVDHFSKMFRSEYGCSPKQFQIRCREEK